LLGLQETTYLAGHRIPMASSPFDPFVAGFSALIAPAAPKETTRLREHHRAAVRFGSTAEIVHLSGSVIFTPVSRRSAVPDFGPGVEPEPARTAATPIKTAPANSVASCPRSRPVAPGSLLRPTAAGAERGLPGAISTRSRLLPFRAAPQCRELVDPFGGPKRNRLFMAAASRSTQSTSMRKGRPRGSLACHPAQRRGIFAGSFWPSRTWVACANFAW
jgi:hypothetical protein